MHLRIAVLFLAGLLAVPESRAWSQQPRAPSSGIEHYDAIARAAEHVSAGRTAEAFESYERLVANEPRDGDLWLLLSRAAMQAGRTARAIEAAERAIAAGFSFTRATGFAS